MSDGREMPLNNGTVLMLYQLMRSVMSSACGAEIGAMFMNTREVVPARKTLAELGHLEPHMPIENRSFGGAHGVIK